MASGAPPRLTTVIHDLRIGTESFDDDLKADRQ